MAGMVSPQSSWWNPATARAKSNDNFLGGSVAALTGDYSENPVAAKNFGTQANDLASKLQALNSLNTTLASNNAMDKVRQQFAPALSPSVAPGGAGKPQRGGNGDFESLFRAMSQKESGGNYGAINKDSGAMGKYQIMPANLGGSKSGWDYDALGRDVSRQEFLNNPKIQDAIARHRFQNYYKDHGAAGALSAWYSGDPNKWNSRTPQGNYPSINAYVTSILKAAGL